MTTGIVIYEKDRYILRLLTEMLKEQMEDAYIIDGNNNVQSEDVLRFCDEIIIVYDDRQYKESFFDDPRAFPLFDKGYIDISKIKSAFRLDPSSLRPDKEKDGITLLIPFVYTDDREDFIRRELSALKDSDVCLRIDYVPAIKNCSEIKGTLSKLIKNSSRRKFMPVQILDYCVLDHDGFFNPGPLSEGYDISDYSKEELSCLLRKIRTLIYDKQRSVSSLIVAEDLKTDRYSSLAPFADRIIILLPDRKTQYKAGMCELIAQVSRAAGGIDVEIRTTDPNEEDYEEAV